MSDFDRELEAELHRVLDPMAATPIPPRRSMHSRTGIRAVVGGAGAALSLKVLSSVAVAAAAVTFAGAATTGSVNPVVWGQQVKQTVADCKAKLSDGQHGIGDCVSDFTTTHGATVASDARHHGNGGPANAHGNNTNANDHAKDKDKVHPTPGKDPSSMNTGDPTDPASHPAVSYPTWP